MDHGSLHRIGTLDDRHPPTAGFYSKWYLLVGALMRGMDFRGYILLSSLLLLFTSFVC